MASLKEYAPLTWAMMQCVLVASNQYKMTMQTLKEKSEEETLSDLVLLDEGKMI